MTLLKDQRVSVVVDDQEYADFHTKFVVEKTIKPEPNTCEISIWNLNEFSRAFLEQLEPKKGQKRGIPARIEAGYKDGTTQIWFGDLRSVDSQYDAPDWVTTITSGDGEKAQKTARINLALGKKTPLSTAMYAILKELGIGTGNLYQFVVALKKTGSTNVYSHGKVLVGSAKQHMTDICRSCDLEWSIQDGVLQLVNRGKPLAAQAILLSDSPAPGTGILQGASVDNKGVLTVKTLMIPDVRVGGLLVMETNRITGNYRIEKATWTGDNYSRSDWTIEMECKRI